ncbi:MAG: hypothetical protein ABJE10_17785 [bacterium]
MNTHRLFPVGLFALLTLSVGNTADAQLVQATGLSPFAKDYKIDFAIPDAPAFKLLEVDQSAILRPQTARDLTVALDGFRGNSNSFVIPKQFGVELSPGLLVGSGQLKVSDYATKKYLYATRFSGAASRDSLNHGQLAAGVRFSLVDEQDMRNKGAAGSDVEVTRLTASILSVYTAVRRRVGPAAALTLNEEEKTAVKALSDSIKQYWADKYWNANSLEFALGARARTADSLGHDPKVDETAAWLTYANGLQGWGQFLFGAKVGAARDSTGSFQSSNTFAARLYLGSNDIKAFVEGQQALASKTQAQWLVNSGVEARLPTVGWINASAGYASNPTGGKPRLISSFKFKTAVP